MIKLDVLGVRMQSAMAHTLTEIGRTDGERIDIDAIPRDDQATYAMIGRSETIGCFQIESPGQRELVKKLAPRDVADLIVDISLFRPGPVNSDMIGPFLRTRHGLAEPRYPHEKLERALRETGGVVVFHEQVLRIIDVMTGCGLAEADLVRRHLSTEGGPERTAPWFRAQALARGFDPATVERVWQVVAAFGGFGFCKAHAAAFAIPVYQSAWLRRHHPAAFYAGVLTHDPGMYPKRVIVADARLSGVQVLPVDVNASAADWKAHPGTQPSSRTSAAPPRRPRPRSSPASRHRRRPAPRSPELRPPAAGRSAARRLLDHRPAPGLRPRRKPARPPRPRRRSAAPCARSRASATPRSPASSPASPTPACATSGTAPGSPARSPSAWSSSAPSTPSTLRPRGPPGRASGRAALRPLPGGASSARHAGHAALTGPLPPPGTPGAARPALALLQPRGSRLPPPACPRPPPPGPPVLAPASLRSRHRRLPRPRPGRAAPRRGTCWPGSACWPGSPTRPGHGPPAALDLFAEAGAEPSTPMRRRHGRPRPGRRAPRPRPDRAGRGRA